eukprot:GHUV01023946.1.p1 GENE.GHUV01023946.1~~GHUV01023946.1.p1  ORF type:complete len:187 (+),score=44.40 GHUV01023946.1:678-1238(+)
MQVYGSTATAYTQPPKLPPPATTHLGVEVSFEAQLINLTCCWYPRHLLPSVIQHSSWQLITPGLCADLQLLSKTWPHANIKTAKLQLVRCISVGGRAKQQQAVLDAAQLVCATYYQPRHTSSRLWNQKDMSSPTALMLREEGPAQQQPHEATPLVLLFHGAGELVKYIFATWSAVQNIRCNCCTLH